MADTKKKQSPRRRKADQASFDPRVVVPVAGAALALLAPAVALGGRAVRERRESEARARVMPALPVGGAVLIVAGALAWLNRDAIVRAAGVAADTAKDLVARASGQLDDVDADELEDDAGDLLGSALSASSRAADDGFSSLDGAQASHELQESFPRA